jgi:hypothetical protein
MKKLLVAFALTFASVTVHAFSPVVTSATKNVKLNAEGCDHYSHIVGAMQRIRNVGGSISHAQNNFRNFIESSSPTERELGRTFNEYAEYIWSQPRNSWTQQTAQSFAENFCFENLSK